MKECYNSILSYLPTRCFSGKTGLKNLDTNEMWYLASQEIEWYDKELSFYLTKNKTKYQIFANVAQKEMLMQRNIKNLQCDFAGNVNSID